MCLTRLADTRRSRAKDLISVFLATREEMENKRINEVFGDDFLRSNFWLYWRTMFAFEEWHSALEMKLYLHRFIHHIGSLADFSSLKFNRYNQYESMVLPLVKWLQDRGVRFRYGVEVTDVDFDIQPGRKQATRIAWIENGVEGGVDLGADDLVFITIGSLTENSDNGDHHTPARLNEGRRRPGTCGAGSRPRTRPLVVPTCSDRTSRKPNGRRRPSPRSTRAFRRTFARSPGAIRSAARW
jgi:myosin-crossreactive antigen